MTGWRASRWLAPAAVVLALAGLVGCAEQPGSDPSQPSPPSSQEPDATASPSPSRPSPSPSAATPVPSDEEPDVAFEPADGEVYPNAKRLAGRVAELLTTYDSDDDWAAVVDQLASSADRRRALTEAAAPLRVDGASSRGEVVYPQLGGRTGDQVSVMVVTRQTLTGPQGTQAVARTLDVRLRIAEGDQWVFDELASAGGAPIARPRDLSPVAVAVVDDPRIELPDSATWDIYAGNVAQPLLELMLEIAEETPYGVVVLSTGHPLNVFGTERVSNHTKGRAVDIYRVGERPVIDQRAEGSRAHDLARMLFELGVPELGSPWAFDGYGGRSFTDVVHQDHLHVGVRPPAPTSEG